MIYSSNSIDALETMERARTGNYGDDEDYDTEFWGDEYDVFDDEEW